MPRRELPVPQALQFPVGMFLAVLDATSDAARQLPGYLIRLPLAGISGAWRLGQLLRPTQPGTTESVWSPQPSTEFEPSASADLDDEPATDEPSTDEAPPAADIAESPESPNGQSTLSVEPEVDEAVNPLGLPAEVLEADVAAGAGLAPDELPLPNYDHMTLGSLRGRLRSLDLVSLVQIRDYERAHANRPPIVSMLDNRILKLTAAAPAPLAQDDGSRL